MEDFSKLPITGSIEKVNVVIEARSPWRLFAGATEVVIIDRGAPANGQFIQLMIDALSDRGITCELGE